MKDVSKDHLYKELISFFGVLHSLLEEKRFFEENGSAIQYDKLAFTRAYFAYVETTNYRLKYLAYEASQIFKIDLSRAEISILLEERYDVSNKGKAKTYDQYFPVINNLKFINRFYKDHFNLKSTIDFRSQEWKSFSDSIKIRNRVTHAKDSLDLIIDDEELEIITQTFIWYQEYIFGIVDESLKEIMYNLEDKESKEFIDSLTKKILSFN